MPFDVGLTCEMAGQSLGMSGRGCTIRSTNQLGHQKISQLGNILILPSASNFYGI